VHGVVAAMLQDVALARPGGPVDHLHHPNSFLLRNLGRGGDDALEVHRRLRRLRRPLAVGQQDLGDNLVRILLVEAAQHDDVASAIGHWIMGVQRNDLDHSALLIARLNGQARHRVHSRPPLPYPKRMSDIALTAPRQTAVRARHAASLLVLRANGGEVLMGLRGAGHRFMPNRLVFPGGAVDREDATSPVAQPLRPGVQAMLEKAAKPRLARALAAAAARELQEETGLTLGSPPALDGLDYLCRAITPPVHPVRFNARFLTVGAAAVTGDLAGSGELEGLRWYGIEEALALDLALITRAVFTVLKTWLALSPHERAARDRTPVFRNRKMGWE